MSSAVKNRAWVKNAAIIFLAVMLVLTFFSNTIMNRALPEVAAQYAQSGTITSKVRATADVKANMTFNVEVAETRIVESVAVRQGDTVEAGQILYYLADRESAELKEAQAQLDTLQLAYDKAKLQLEIPDYTADENEIAQLEQDLAEARTKRDEIAAKNEKVKKAKAAVRSAQNYVDSLTDKQASIQEQIAALSEGSSALKQYQQALDQAKKALETAKKNLENIKAEGDIDAARKTVDELVKTLEDEQLKLNRMNEDLQRLYLARDMENAEYQAAYDDAVRALEEALHTVSYDENGNPIDNSAAVNAAQANVEAARRKLGTASDADILAQQRAIEDQHITITRTQKSLDAARQELSRIEGLSFRKQQLESEVTRCEGAVDAAQNNFDNALESASSSLKLQLDTVKTQLRAAQHALEDANTALSDAQAEASTTTEQADADIKAKERELEAKRLALAQKKEKALNDAALSNLDMQAQADAIEKQKALIETLKKKDTGATITAQYGGVVTSLSAVAGDTVSTGSVVAVIEVVEKGYTLQFTVTTEQAKLIRTGDVASINSWWGSDTVVTVTGIRSDPQSAGKSKIIVCSVEGDVTVGQSLSIVLGERGASYDIVIPNSAIREDSNGKFILVVESKSSPLGNRYIATRADITILASDDNSSAVSGALYGNEFVITTSTKPIEAGQQVRMVET